MGRRAELFRFAGATALADEIDPGVIDSVIVDVEAHLRSRELQLAK